MFDAAVSLLCFNMKFLSFLFKNYIVQILLKALKFTIDEKYTFF